MKNIVIAVAVLGILVLFSTAHAEETETLLGVAVNPEAKTITIDVSSSGCTDKGYFTFALENDVLIFKRIKRDACKAMPHRTTITYSLAEIGIKSGSSLRIGNAITFSEKLF
jgi:hypothetical protein